MIKLSLKLDGPYYRAANAASVPLLKHVSNGSSGITPSFWNDQVKALVTAHGWTWEILNASE